MKLTSALLAVLLVGCSGNLQHRSTNAQTELAKPQPAPVAAASAQDEAPATVFKDDSPAVPQEDARQPERFVDDAAASQDQSQAPVQRFTDETSAADDQSPAQQSFVDDDARAESDSASAPQKFTDDGGSAPEEDIVAAQPRFADDTAGVADEATPGAAQFSDEAAPATEEAAAPSSFADEGSQSAPEELVREPDNFADDKPASTADAQTAPATVLPMTITVEADPLFDFDQYSIRPESLGKLDELIQQLQGTAYGEVRMVGFADPIGSALYNQSLSERRAASVKQYLASKGIPVERIRTEGRGETEEYATYNRCTGQGRQKLVACLQPDRRVEVTVTAGSQP